MNGQREYGDMKVYEFFERSKNLSGNELVKYKTCYYKKCCSEFTNIGKQNRDLQRYTDALEQGKSTVVKRKTGRSSIDALETENEVKQLRSQSIKYDKDLCIICQKTSERTHRVETLETGKLLPSVAN